MVFFCGAGSSSSTTAFLLVVFFSAAAFSGFDESALDTGLGGVVGFEGLLLFDFFLIFNKKGFWENFKIFDYIYFRLILW